MKLIRYLIVLLPLTSLQFFSIKTMELSSKRPVAKHGFATADRELLHALHNHNREAAYAALKKDAHVDYNDYCDSRTPWHTLRTEFFDAVARANIDKSKKLWRSEFKQRIIDDYEMTNSWRQVEIWQSENHFYAEIDARSVCLKNVYTIFAHLIQHNCMPLIKKMALVLKNIHCYDHHDFYMTTAIELGTTQEAINEIVKITNFNRYDSDIRKYFLHAAEYGNENAIQVLLSTHNVTPNIASYEDLDCVIGWRYAFIKYSYINLPDSEHIICDTPLLSAVNHGHLGTVRLLLEKGANPNQADRYGIDPLTAAADTQQWDIAQILKAQRARPIFLQKNYLDLLPHDLQDAVLLYTTTDQTKKIKSDENDLSKALSAHHHFAIRYIVREKPELAQSALAEAQKEQHVSNMRMLSKYMPQAARLSASRNILISD